MTRGEWILLVVGVVSWVWLLRQAFSRNGFFDKPMGCAGCQRHRLIPGCPVHDPQARKGSA